MDRLKLPPVSVLPHEGDDAVAQKVAAAILREIERAPSENPGIKACDRDKSGVYTR
jgi:hypothetical protein